MIIKSDDVLVHEHNGINLKVKTYCYVVMETEGVQDGADTER